MQRRCCWPPERAYADLCSASLTSSQSAAPLKLLSTTSASALRPACAGLLIFAASILLAGDPPAVPLWPKGAPGETPLSAQEADTTKATDNMVAGRRAGLQR